MNDGIAGRRGRPCKLSQADQHELRRYREAGVSIERLASMWSISKATVYQILADQREKLGPEQLPKEKRHLTRRHLYGQVVQSSIPTSENSGQTSTSR